MKNEVKKWFIEEYAAIKKDFGAGIMLVLTIGIILLVVQIIIKVLDPVVTLFTDNWILKMVGAVMIILFFGIITRKLKENKKTAWIINFLPTRSMDQPEMTYWKDGVYYSGILLGYRDIPVTEAEKTKIVKYAIISKVNAGPTSITLLSPEYIPVSENIQPSGRKLKDVVKELATLGTFSS